MKSVRLKFFILFQVMLFLAVHFVVVAAETTENSKLSRSSYFTTRENKRLLGHVFKRFDSPSLLSCGHECMRNEWCSSANFKVSIKENDKGSCELNKHNSSDVLNENTKLLDENRVTFLMFLEGCAQFDSNEVCVITGKSCQDIKRDFPHAPDGMYHLQPNGGLSKFWAYCDMTSFGGGWTTCYSTTDKVDLKAEVTYNKSLPYGKNGYRSDCNSIAVNGVLFTTFISLSFLLVS